MSENALISKIINKAEAERDTILAEGEEKIRRLTKEANDASENRCAEMLASAEKDAADILRTSALTDQLDRRKAILHAKKETVDTAFEMAYQKLAALSDDDHLRLMKSLITANAPAGNFLLKIPEKDRQFYTPAVLGELEKAISEKTGATVSIGICEEPANILGGAVIVFDTYDIDLSFEEILWAARERIEADIADILFDA